MNQITLKLYTLLCFVLLHLQMWAQDDDYMASRGRMSPEELSEGMEGMMEYSPRTHPLLRHHNGGFHPGVLLCLW